jgi:acyl-CoA synthetase (AMP-forming)/AMP-acid ligase II
VGRADRVKGEVPVAFVRLADGAGTSPEDIVAWAREHLADYKAPVEVRVVDDLPRTGTGKVAKHELRERL